MLLINIFSALTYRYSPPLALTREHIEKRGLRDEYSM